MQTSLMLAQSGSWRYMIRGCVEVTVVWVKNSDVYFKDCPNGAPGFAQG